MSRGEVTIRVLVQRGKEVILSSLVPLKTGIHYEFPEPLDLDDGTQLLAVDVNPTTATKEVRRKFQEEVAFEIEAKTTETRGETSAAHVHEVAAASLRAFSSCVRPEACVLGAHGGNSFRQQCRCGAVRYLNSNSGRVEVGRWGDGRVLSLAGGAK